MKKNFTRLVCVGLWIAFCFVAVAQQSTLQMSENGFMLQQNEVEPRIGENKWPTVWPNSIITYWFSGELYTKREFVSSSANNALYNFYTWENNAWVMSGGGYYTYTKSEYDFDPYIDEGETMTGIRFPTLEAWMSLYVSDKSNPNPAPKVERNPNGQITYAEGNMYSISFTYNSRGQISTVIHNASPYVNYYQYQYDENGNFISFLKNGRLETAALYDSQGKKTRQYIYSTLPEYNIFNVFYYPDGNTSVVNPASNNPVGSSNQGSFSVASLVPNDSLSNASMVFELPDGFMLDENNTSLSATYSDSHDLKIAKQENNCWLVEIQPKTLRSAALRADGETDMLYVAYTVDEKVKQGTYSIAINSILFTTKGGNEFPEPAFTVPSVVERLGVVNEQIESAGAILYLTDQTLYIQSERTERITIYSIMGQKLHETAIQLGLHTINASQFPQGILIIKGSSGWIKKLIVK